MNNPFDNVTINNSFDNIIVNNPFDNININNQSNNDSIINNNIIEEYKIEIWVENIGRKKNTYISGWNICNTLLKDHIKNIKKKNGCNGTIKKIQIDSLEKIVILLQGNHCDFMYNYLINQNINKKYIHIKG